MKAFYWLGKETGIARAAFNEGLSDGKDHYLYEIRNHPRGIFEVLARMQAAREERQRAAEASEQAAIDRAKGEL